MFFLIVWIKQIYIILEPSNIKYEDKVCAILLAIFVLFLFLEVVLVFIHILKLLRLWNKCLFCFLLDASTLLFIFKELKLEISDSFFFFPCWKRVTLVLHPVKPKNKRKLWKLYKIQGRNKVFVFLRSRITWFIYFF